MYERKRVAVISVFTLCLVIALAVIFGSFLSRAEEKKSDVIYYKYYTSIEIQPGDTLWDLADDYMEHYETKASYIREVEQINALTDSKIISGQTLLMPYYSTEYKL